MSRRTSTQDSPREPQLSLLSSFLSGLLFAAGLGLAGMTDPQKILSFLTLNENWSPSLLVVMAGALGVSFPLFSSILKRKSPILSRQFHLPHQKAVDRPLIQGSLLFGVGWGLSGYCPGPLLVAAGAYPREMAGPLGLFLVGLFIGIFLKRRGTRSYP